MSQARPDPGQVLTVSELTSGLRASLEESFPLVWVRGEVSNLRRHSSGHSYFSLRDAGAQLRCVLFRGDAIRQKQPLEDGRALLLAGRLTLYEARGDCQMIVRHVLDDGLGLLQQRYEALKQSLLEEGLFDPEGKRELPALPRRLALITSPTGAAIQDFLSVLRRRQWGGEVLLLPVRVQGEEATPEIVAALKQVAELDAIELVVVCRGGGSLEDLWCFNEEALVRAVAACPLPVVSGVGHETDTTLCDLAADRRAETPTAAAELISSLVLEQRERYLRLARDLLASGAYRLESLQQAMRLQASRLVRTHPRAVVEHRWLALDETSGRLREAYGEHLRSAERRLTQNAARLQAQAPGPHLRLQRQRLTALSHRLTQVGKRQFEHKHEALQALEQRHAASEIGSILQRGFVLVRDAQGRILDSRAGVEQGAELELEWSDGRARAKVE